MEQFYTILTEVGKAKIANAAVLDEKVNLTKFQVGDSNGQYYNPSETQTILKNKVWESNINSIATDPNNPNWIVISATIPSNTGGFTIREAGVFDSEGYLIAVSKLPETYKPTVDNGSSKDITVKMILEVSNTDSVVIKVDPTVTLATKKDLQTVEAKFKSTIGDLNNLKTSNKTNIVAALNETFEKVDNIELKGSKVTIEDTGDYFTSGTVEGALQELALTTKNLDTEVNGQRLRAINLANSLESKL